MRVPPQSASTPRPGSDAMLPHFPGQLSLFPSDKPYLQLGGNETVGMGWCRINQVNQAKG